MFQRSTKKTEVEQEVEQLDAYLERFLRLVFHCSIKYRIYISIPQKKPFFGFFLNRKMYHISLSKKRWNTGTPPF